MTSQDPPHNRRRRQQQIGLDARPVMKPSATGPVAAAERAIPPDGSPGLLNRRFPLTDMPTWLMLALVALGLPRTVLADLDIVAPRVLCSTTSWP